MILRRHDLLDVDPEVWGATIACLGLPPEAARVVADWCRRGRPVIVRRRLADDPPGAVPVALQLPNAYGRLRLALAIPRGNVMPRAPVLLAAAAEAAPARWRPTIEALIALGASFGPPSVYGGLMWQYLTGEPILRADSDLDLLWRPDPAHREALIRELERLDGDRLRVDGEIELEDGAASWRELRAVMRGLAQTVLVKTIDKVELRDAAMISHGEFSTC